MKRVLAVALALIMMSIPFTALAATIQKGETITVEISILETDGGENARIHLDPEGAPVTFVSATASSAGGNMVVQPLNFSGCFSIANINGVAVGAVGTVTLQVNDNAAPGTYTVKVIGSLSATKVTDHITFTVASAAYCDKHNWDDGTVTKSATCSENGVKTYTCRACGETKTEPIAAQGHDSDSKTIIRNKVEPTNKSEGYTGDVYCLDCGTMIEKGRTIPKVVAMPQTGDSFQLLTWLLLMSFGGGTLVLLKRKSKCKQ